MITVREKLLDVVAARLAAIAFIGKVIDVADADVQEIAAVIADGKCVVEIHTGDDEAVDSVTNLDTYEFDLSLISYLPKIDGRKPSAIAADIGGQIYTTFCSTGVVPAIAGGAAAEANLLEGFACNVISLGGNAAGFDPQVGCHQGYNIFRVQYRHVVGDPTQ